VNLYQSDKYLKIWGIPAMNYGWAVMGGLWMSSLIIPMVVVSLGIMLPQMTEDLSISPVQAGLLGSAMFVSSAIASLPVSIYLSRYSPKRVITFAIFMAGIFALMQGFAQTYYILLVGRLLFTTTIVVRTQAEVLLIQQWFTLRQFALVVSVAVGVFSSGQLVALGTTAWLMELFAGWRNLYYVLGIILLIEVVIWILIGKDKPKVDPDNSKLEENNKSPIGILFKEKTLWILALCPTGAALAFGSVLTFWPTYALESLNLDLKTVGSLMTLFPVGGTAASFLGGPLSNRVRQRRIFIWLPGIFLPIIYIILFTTKSPAIIAIMLLFAGWNAMIWVPILRIIPLDLQLAPRQTAVAVGLSMTIIPIGGAIGPTMVGFIQEWSGSLQYGLLGVSLFPITLLIGGLMLRETMPSNAVLGIDMSSSGRPETEKG
jgi:predicted MFS family arabinose efflux permease